MIFAAAPQAGFAEAPAGDPLLPAPAAGDKADDDAARSQLKHPYWMMALAGIARLGTTTLSKDPVNLANGNFIYQNTDIAVGGAFPLSFTRFYNSIDDVRGTSGYNWHNSYETRLVYLEDGPGIIFGDGHWEIYEGGAGGPYASPPGIYNTLAAEGGGFRLTMPDGLGYMLFDAEGRLTGQADANGNEADFAYDKRNSVQKVVDPNGGVALTEYDANGNVKKLTNADGGYETYAYDALDRLASRTDSEGGVFATEYDAAGNIAKETDARGNSRTYAYDLLGRRVSETDEAGSTSLTEYDADGRAIRHTDARGAVTLYEYDGNGNAVKAADAHGNETALAYDSMGRVASITEPNGAATLFEYTPTGKVAKATDALGGETKYEYDLLGRLAKETDALGRSTEYAYDALGRAVSVKDPMGNTETFAYDALGRIKTATDANGAATEYVRDANGNIIETIDALGSSSHFEYDAMDRLVKATLRRIDPLHGVDEAQETLYEHDRRGLVAKEISALGDGTVYVYDANGNLAQKTDADGYVTGYAYDPRNLVEAINYSDGRTVGFAYNENGELAAMDDWNGHTSFTLDLLGQIVSATDSNGKTVGYSYDAAGNQTAIEYPDATSVLYEYDLLGRLSKLTDADGQETVYAYDAASQLLSAAYPNGWAEEHEYDAAGRLTRTLQAKPGSPKEGLAEYFYDAAGNITKKQVAEKTPGGDPETYLYAYDALGRLTHEETLGCIHSADYTYDSLGNLIYERTGVVDWAGIDYQYNALNQLVAKAECRREDLTFAYEYDGRGNLVKETKGGKAEAAYLYDSANRLAKGMNSYGETSEYVYDGLGNLIGQLQNVMQGYYGFNQYYFPETANDPMGAQHGAWSASGKQLVAKSFVIDYTSGLKNILVETDAKTEEFGAQSRKYVYGLQKLSVAISQETPGQPPERIAKLYLHHDRLGSVGFATDAATGAVLSRSGYDTWGREAMAEELSVGGESWAFTEYTVHVYDPVLGLYYAKARMYDAENRRFVSADPAWSFENVLKMEIKALGEISTPIPTAIELLQTENLYAYAINNPIAFVDRTGENIDDIIYGASLAIDDNQFGGLIQWITDKLSRERDIENYQDFFLGRVVGDAASMLISSGASVCGVLEVVGSIAAGGAITGFSGGALTVGGVSIAVGGTTIGTATITYGSLTLTASSDRFSKDYEMYDKLSRSSGGGGNSDKPKSPQKATDEFIEQHKLDAHQIKRDYLGNKASIKQFEIYYDKSDGQLWIKRIKSDVFIPTGEYV
ncbi:MAG: DUF6531 domain-containing protein [Clostridiales bacterium]|nr:DUF6531 domain-containing protein [Clostridiales bacterium]MDR1439342.1 DUF6531 domain-containing protein [Clostridiales bacterium]